MMNFIWSPMLLLLPLVLVFIVVYVRMQRQRKIRAARYGSLGLVQTGRDLGVRRHLPFVLFLLALTVLIVALARPETEVLIPRIEGNIVLAFDNSGSMAADDLAPSRLEAAKAAVQDFVKRQPLHVQLGVVAFSESGFAIQALTYDQTEVLAAINRMTPQNSTSLANGILAALHTLESANIEPSYYTIATATPMPTPTAVPPGTYTSGAIILLTDGENTSELDPLEVAQLAVERGVRIFTVGIGSAAGTVLELDGFSIHTRLDEGMLRALAQMTGGVYFNASDEEELRQIYDDLSPQLVLKTEKTEITSILAGVGIVLLLIGGTISLLWFGRVP